MPPVVGFALWELGWIRVRELPMMAAVWLAEGFDGPDLRILAGLTQGEINDVREDLWRSALVDAGVDVASVRVHRTAAPFLAERQLAGEMSERELCHTLWPHGGDADGATADEELQTFIYRWDDLLDCLDTLVSKSRHGLAATVEINALRSQSQAAVNALARGDIAAATRAI